MQEGSINVYKYLGESIKKTEADFSHWAPVCTVRSSRNNPKYRKFQSNIPKTHFHCEEDQTVEQVAQRGSESCILGGFRATIHNSEQDEVLWLPPGSSGGWIRACPKVLSSLWIPELFTNGNGGIFWYYLPMENRDRDIETYLDAQDLCGGAGVCYTPGCFLIER